MQITETKVRLPDFAIGYHNNGANIFSFVRK